MKDLIKRTQKEWLKAKKDIADRFRPLCPDIANQLDQCTLFTGNETLEELVKLMFSPQGREFMLSNHFPNMEILRKFKNHKLEDLKVYIDSGKVYLENPGECFAIGNTDIEIKCDKTQKNNIILMNGAKATIFGFNYSVINVETDNLSNYEIFPHDFCRVL